MYQQITIVGRLGRDPELRYSPTGTPVASFNVATDRVWNNDQGEKQQETTWHRVTTWKKQAEICAQYLVKGSMVLVTGTVKAQGYVDKEGEPQASLELRADQVKFLSTKGDQATQTQGGGEQSGSSQSGAAVYEEDVPF